MLTESSKFRIIIHSECFCRWKMMLLKRHLTKLSSVLVLLIIVQECLVFGGPHGVEVVPSTHAPDTNQGNGENTTTASQSAPLKSNRLAGTKQKLTPNKEKWRERGKRIVEFFKRKPVIQEDTLKEVKVALVVLYKLMDSKIFDNYRNPLSSRIDHFDVKNHLFTRQYIKTYNPYNERFMNIYDKFLKECCHPLLDMYQQRLSDDQTEEQKKGNIKYNPESTPYQEPPKPIANIPPANSQDPSQQIPAQKAPSSKKRIAKLMKSIPKPANPKKRGPFQPQALTYWQKALIYRTLKWAKFFLILPRYGPSILLKRKLDGISDKYAMNLLDPVFGNLKPRTKYFDCTPSKPTDLENCCIDKDKSIEHIYHLSDVYNKQKNKIEEEKRERKRLGIKKGKKKDKIDKTKLSNQSIFKRKLKKDLVEYGFYPEQTTKKELLIQVVNVFLPDKFETIFSMKPKIAKKIIRKRYKIRKYRKRAVELGMQGIQVKPASNEQLYSQPQIATNDPVVKENQALSAETFQGENVHKESNEKSVETPQEKTLSTKPTNTETWQQKWIVRPWFVFSHAVVGVLTCCGKYSKGGKKAIKIPDGPNQGGKQPIKTSDGRNHTPAHIESETHP